MNMWATGKGSENAITKDLSQAKMEKLPGE